MSKWFVMIFICFSAMGSSFESDMRKHVKEGQEYSGLTSNDQIKELAEILLVEVADIAAFAVEFSEEKFQTEHGVHSEFYAVTEQGQTVQYVGFGWVTLFKQLGPVKSHYLCTFDVAQEPLSCSRVKVEFPEP